MQNLAPGEISKATLSRSQQDVYEFGDYIALLKPRVMSLVVFTVAVGLFVAPGPVEPILAFGAILFVAIGAGASGALNMWWDSDIDRIMTRTKNRPIPAGRLHDLDALNFGLWLSGISILMLGLVANWLAAGLLAFTIFFYVVIYTIWLKRATPQNIVIGGAAGALPPVIGWAIATGGISIEALGMFAVIFMWTPPHFWALALFSTDDYAKAGVPMLTVTHGHKATRLHILIYTILLAPVALALGFSSIGGPIYGVFTVVLNLCFIGMAWQIYRRSDTQSKQDNYRIEKRFFWFSLLYLFLHFATLVLDTILRKYDLLSFPWPKIL